MAILAAAIAVLARARLLPSLLIKKWSWVRILAKSTLSHKTVHSPAVSKFGAHLPHTPPPGHNDVSRVPSPPKGPCGDGARAQNAKHPG